jgi:flagellar basal body-associated protein FliL
MSRTSCWVSRLLTLAVAALAISGLIDWTGPESSAETTARILAPGDPVAVISPLPDTVSNGTRWDLNGSGSQGVIVDYFWNVTLGGVSTYLGGQSETYRFNALGLYKITLTVTDNWNRTSTAFTAVVAVLDSDQDTLPDWWELKYFKNLDQTADGDFDRDGYDNLEEYAKGTDPTVKDPRPTFVQMVKENWVVAVILVAAIVGAVLALMPFINKRRRKKEKEKIAAAIAIEKAIEEDGK